MGIELNQSLGKIALKISSSLGYSHVTVESVLYNYMLNLIQRAVTKRSVVIPGVTSIKVIKSMSERGKKDYLVWGRVSPTLKKRLEQVSAEEEIPTTLSSNTVWELSTIDRIPVTTVDRIMRAFVEELIAEAVTTGRIVLPGFTTIKVFKDDTGTYGTRGRVSPALQSRLVHLDEVAV